MAWTASQGRQRSRLAQKTCLVASLLQEPEKGTPHMKLQVQRMHVCKSCLYTEKRSISLPLKDSDVQVCCSL